MRVSRLADLWARYWPHLRHSRLGRGTLTLQAGGVVQRGIAFVTHVLLVRTLGVEDYGAYALVLALVSLLPLLFDVGIRRTVITRYAALADQDADDEKARILAFALKTSLWTVGIGVLLGVPLVLGISQLVYGRPELGQWAAVLGICALLSFPQTVAVAVLEAGRHMGRVQLLELSAEVLRLVTVTVVVLSGMTLTRLIFGLAIAELTIGAVGVAAWVLTTWQLPSLLPSRQALGRMMGKSMLRDFAPELRFGLMASGAKRSAQLVLIGVPLILGALAGTREVGLLRMAWTLGSLPIWFMTALSRNLLPALSQRRSLDDHRGFGQILRISVGIGAILGLVSCGILALSGPWAVALIYGDGAADAVTVLYGLLPYVLVVGCSLAHESVYLVRDDVKALIVRSLIVASVTLAAAPFAMEAWGALGAALTISGGAFLGWLADLRRIWGVTTRVSNSASS